ncbi:hypothetical protein [Sinomicrobium weinanense]|uniref:Uncharacterized protein n=1 Tax=Sinomicrobium weinanense TaxID=2842200 RepID=A0A926Q2R9_9FLAO|nr:hypothetical protein [Sinomicrobium weinanense]MBC9794965.1 hypothetical protein [Sinomicrobium weinanense]MBU3125174.1 hypothetical protein [Sinomicrobium weinanense]
MKKKMLTIIILATLLISCKETHKLGNPGTSAAEANANGSVKDEAQQAPGIPGDHAIEKLLNGLQPGTRKDSL